MASNPATGKAGDSTEEGRLEAVTPQNDALRDPRRANGTSEQGQDQNQGYNDVLRCLQDFGSRMISVANATAERDRLAKRVRRTETELNKANDRQTQFPSLSSQLKMAKQSRDEEFSRIESKLQSHVKIRDDLMRDLAGRISTGSEEVSQLRALNGDVTTAISKADSAFAGVTRFEENLANYVTLSRFKKFEEQQQKLGGEIQQAGLDVDGLKQATDGTFRDLKSSNSLLAQRMQQLEDAIGSMRKEASQSDVEKEAQLSSVRNLETIYKGLNDKVDLLYSERNRSSPPSSTPKADIDVEAFKSDLQGLSEQIENLRRCQEEKDNAIADDLEHMQTSSDRLGVEIRKTQAELTTLQNTLEKRSSSAETHSSKPGNLPSAVPQTLMPSQIAQASSVNGAHQPSQGVSEQPQFLKNITGQMAYLNKIVESHSNGLSSHHISLQSLESRYNHLSTEPIVHQMVAAMQNMYPFASTAQTEIQALKEHVNRLSTEIDRITAESRVNVEDTAKGFLDKEALIRDMNVERDLLNSRLDDVAKKFQEVDGKVQDMERITVHKLAKVLTSAEKFRREIDDLTRKHHLVEKLEAEVGQLKESLKGLERTLGQQNGKPDPFLDKIQTLKQEIDDLRERIEPMAQLQSDLHETETRSDVFNNSIPQPPRGPAANFRIKGISNSSGALGPSRKALKRTHNDMNSPRTSSDRDT